MRVEAPFKVGDRVRHPTFGDGLVLEVSPRGDDLMLRVSFSKDNAQRKVLARTSRVERVDASGEPRR